MNNAGILMTGKVEGTTPEAWDAVLDVNAEGVLLSTRTLTRERWKAIGGTQTMTACHASKGALRLLTK